MKHGKPHTDANQSDLPNTLHTLEGERGAPQVKTLNTTLPRTWISAFIFGLLLLALALVHYTYKKRVPVASHAAQKREPPMMESSIPNRSFDRQPAAPAASLPIPTSLSSAATFIARTASGMPDRPLPDTKFTFPYPMRMPIQPMVMPAWMQKQSEKKSSSLDKSSSALMVSKEVALGSSAVSVMDGISLGRLTGRPDIPPVMGAMNAREIAQTEESLPTNQTAQGMKPHALGELLQSTNTPMQRARHLGNRNFIVPKGTFINCVLQTKLDTSVAGMTRCGVTQHIYSDNGKVVLIERGSTVFGEYQAGMDQGIKRVFVLWSRLKTPNGTVIDLDSPATDALGATGLSGHVDTHFWARFGGAMAISLIDDIGKALVRPMHDTEKNGTTIHFGSTHQTSQDMATEALKRTINIPSTLYKNQGGSVAVYLARDLDFSEVYDVSVE